MKFSMIQISALDLDDISKDRSSSMQQTLFRKLARVTFDLRLTFSLLSNVKSLD